MLYSYRAVDQSGRYARGEREAGSERELADALRHDGLLLLEATSPEPATAGLRRLAALPNPFSRITLLERLVFARHLAVMIGAGLALTRSLDALAAQSSNPKFQSVLRLVRSAVVSGKSLADALRPQERIFGALFVHMVEAGEISGNLERVLKILARQMQRDHELRAKVRGAMLYPAIVVGALILVGVLMLIWVVPTLTQTFRELEIDLPFSTRLILSSSEFIVAYLWYVAGASVLVILGAARLLKTPAGRRTFDRLVLRVPLFGALVKKLNSARLARTLSSLITSGVPIIRALEVTAAVLGNIHFRNSLAEAAEAIQKGRPLSEILAAHPTLYPPLVTEMIQVGEETGTIARMLLRLALFYEEEVSNVTKNLASIIEPLLMLVIGALVGFFAFAMIQPIYGGLGNL